MYLAGISGGVHRPATIMEDRSHQDEMRRALHLRACCGQTHRVASASAKILESVAGSTWLYRAALLNFYGVLVLKFGCFPVNLVQLLCLEAETHSRLLPSWSVLRRETNNTSPSSCLWISLTLKLNDFRCFAAFQLSVCNHSMALSLFSKLAGVPSR
jgi:hypothetical protein